MELLTVQDFNQIPYNIPDAEVTSPDGTIVDNTQLTNYINSKVEDVLIKLLGVSIYDSFVSGIDALPSAWATVTVYAIDDEVLFNNFVWKSLVAANTGNSPVEGVNWTKVENKWLMLRDGVRYYSDPSWVWGGMKKLLIPYIYALWLRDTHDDHTKVGVVIRTAENATVISPAKRISRAYNEFASTAGSFYYQRNTLFGYLMYAQTELEHFTDLYDNVVYETFGEYLRKSFQVPGSMNYFNI